MVLLISDHSPWWQAAITFAHSSRRRALRFYHHHRVIVTGVCIVISIVAVRLMLFGSGFREPSSSDLVGSILYTVDGADGWVRLDFDQTSRWTIISDDRLPGETVYVRGSRVVIRVHSRDLLVSVAYPDLFPTRLSLVPSILAESLDRGPRECTHATAEEIARVRFFFERKVPKSGFGIRGRTTFLDQTGKCPVHAVDETLHNLSLPELARAIPIDELSPQDRKYIDRTLDKIDEYWLTPKSSS